MAVREPRFEDANRRARQRILARKRKRQKELIQHILLCSAVVIGLLSISAVMLKSAVKNMSNESGRQTLSKYVTDAPEYSKQLLPVNKNNRPGTAIEKVNGVVIHYTANPGSTAQQNRNYFENMAKTGERKVSSHFIIGLSGEIIMCVPLDEVAYASNERNADTISIECCIDNEEGKFDEKTYESLVALTAWLVGEYDLTLDEVIRHYDVTGKNCPKYFVEHESAWEDFKIDLETYIDKNGIDKV